MYRNCYKKNGYLKKKFYHAEEFFFKLQVYFFFEYKTNSIFYPLKKY